jgi:hypothetical protein
MGHKNNEPEMNAIWRALDPAGIKQPFKDHAQEIVAGSRRENGGLPTIPAEGVSHATDDSRKVSIQRL